MLRTHQAGRELIDLPSSPILSPVEPAGEGRISYVPQALRQTFVLPQPCRQHDHDADHDHGGSQRRRIAVACARCRRRKIKCTGDPGDGTGCHACKTSGSDVSQCLFHRVGSSIMAFQDTQDMVQRSHSEGRLPVLGLGTHHVLDSRVEIQPRYRTIDHRSSLPVLHSAMPAYGDVAYDSYGPQLPAISTRSNVGYSYYSPTDYSRAYSVAGGPMTPYCHNSIPPAATPGQSQHDIHYYAGTGQAASSEGLATMNLHALSSSLPVQVNHGRRLPVPYTTYMEPQYVPFGDTGLRTAPHVSFRPLPAQDRLALPWAYDRDHIASLAAATTAHTAVSSESQTQTHAPAGTAIGEPVLGYQFTTNATPVDVGPTSGADQNDRVASTHSARSSVVDIPRTQQELSAVVNTPQHAPAVGPPLYEYTVNTTERGPNEGYATYVYPPAYQQAHRGYPAASRA